MQRVPSSDALQSRAPTVFLYEHILLMFSVTYQPPPFTSSEVHEPSSLNNASLIFFNKYQPNPIHAWSNFIRECLLLPMPSYREVEADFL